MCRWRARKASSAAAGGPGSSGTRGRRPPAPLPLIPQPAHTHQAEQHQAASRSQDEQHQQQAPPRLGTGASWGAARARSGPLRLSPDVSSSLDPSPGHMASMASAAAMPSPAPTTGDSSAASISGQHRPTEAPRHTQARCWHAIPTAGRRCLPTPCQAGHNPTTTHPPCFSSAPYASTAACRFLSSEAGRGRTRGVSIVLT